MRVDILTLFPEMFIPLKESIIGRASDSGKVQIVITDIRDYTADKHKKCDDYPFGGGAGMVMMPQPIFDAFKHVDPDNSALHIFMSPQGQTFSHELACEFASYEHIVILCGHYEGVDQRVIDNLIDKEISIGDYVLTGGELPAMVIIDSLARQIPGVIDGESLLSESFSGEEKSLEYPQYTRPANFNGLEVPEILLSGDHGKIAKWRKEMSEKITAIKRPDLLNKEK